MAYGNIREDLGSLSSKSSRQGSGARQGRYSTDYQLNLKEEREKLERYNALKLEYAKRYNKEVAKLTKKQQEELNKEFASNEEKRLAKSLKQQAEYYKKRAELEEDADKKAEYTELARKKELYNKIGEAADNAINNVLGGIQSYMGTFSNYMGEIEARLQGSAKSYAGITRTIRANLSTSPYVKQTEVFNQLRELISQGIAYNVEQRAFLGTVSKNIATTFSVANSTLLQLIRIQQADTTAARLGLEASLTKYFNAMFGDTSYLNQTFKTVSASLLGSTSQLGAQRGVEYEYAVQKWLGSLGSLGVSESTLTSIAQGINMLGTGDITGLAGNQQLRNLLLMGAQRGGVSFTDVMSSGMSATAANQLLGGVVSYIQEIARTQNQVVRSQYANLFGVTLSDMTAIMNLTSKDLADISKNMLSYSGAVLETTNQLNQVGSRLSLKNKLDNLIENSLVGAAERITGSAGSYLGWTAADLLQKSGLDIPIPSIMGFDTKQTVGSIAKLGIAGSSLLMNLVGGVLSSLSNGNIGGLGLNAWGGDKFFTRGGNVVQMTGRSRGTSTAFYVGTATESDIVSGSIASAKETEAYKSAEAEQADTPLMKLLSEDISPNVKNISDIIGQIRDMLSREIGGFTL